MENGRFLWGYEVDEIFGSTWLGHSKISNKTIIHNLVCYTYGFSKRNSYKIQYFGKLAMKRHKNAKHENMNGVERGPPEYLHSVETQWVRDIKAVICRNERLCAEEFLYKHYLKDELRYNAARAPASAVTKHDDAAMQTIHGDSSAHKLAINNPIKVPNEQLLIVRRFLCKSARRCEISMCLASFTVVFQIYLCCSVFNFSYCCSDSKLVRRKFIRFTSFCLIFNHFQDFENEVLENVIR